MRKIITAIMAGMLLIGAVAGPVFAGKGGAPAGQSSGQGQGLSCGNHYGWTDCGNN